MDHDDPAEVLTELREKRLGLLEIVQAAAGSGLAVYTVWALLLQPGFRRVPLRLQVRLRAWRGTNTGARQGPMGGFKASVGSVKMGGVNYGAGPLPG